jgi:hypothetical protein
MASYNFLDSNLFVKALERVFTLEFFQLSRCVLVKELVNGQISTANTDINLVLVYSNMNFLGAKLIDSVTLTHEHDLELLSVGEVVNVFGQLAVHDVTLQRNVHGNSSLQVDDVLFQSGNLLQGSFQFVLTGFESS